MGHKLNKSNYSTHTPTMTHTRRSELRGREEEEKKTAHKGLAGSGLLQGNDRSSPACVCEGKRERETERERAREGGRERRGSCGWSWPKQGVDTTTSQSLDPRLHLLFPGQLARSVASGGPAGPARVSRNAPDRSSWWGQRWNCARTAACWIGRLCWSWMRRWQGGSCRLQLEESGAGSGAGQPRTSGTTSATPKGSPL